MDSHDFAVLHPDAVVLRACVPTELIDVTTRDHFESPFVGSPVWIRADNVVVTRDVRRRSRSGA